MTVHDILEAPGEVVPKSGYRTLCGWMVLLRFLRPVCLAVPRSCFRRSKRWERSDSLTWCRLRRPTPRITEAVLKSSKFTVWKLLFSLSHCMLSLTIWFAVHKENTNVIENNRTTINNSTANLIVQSSAGVAEAHRWDFTQKLSLGIVKGLDHLHEGLGFLDFGLHLVLSSAEARDMLESLVQGYKASELGKMRKMSAK
ncbi:uncharacterized protein LOC122023112 [Zingiber officinale]|nr:uncharacterized protein LOC122023112 [Zingiber officinale]